MTRIRLPVTLIPVMIAHMYSVDVQVCEVCRAQKKIVKTYSV